MNERISLTSLRGKKWDGLMGRKPLEGIRVIDLTRVLAGPYTTMMLADLGAEVIKIEQPGTGDDSRQFGPFKNGESGYYIFLNRGKQGMTLNLKEPRGRQILFDLVKISDVVIENFKPGVTRKLGIDYEQLCAHNPKLIMCSISGFGQSGPLSDRPAYDLVVQAMSGMMSINGYPDSLPLRTGISLGDMSAAMYAGMGVMTALYHRERTGEGQYLDISMMDSVFAFLESNVVRYSIGGVVPQRVGSRHPLSSPFDIYRAQDGYIVIAVANDKQFVKLCDLMGRPELAADERYRTNDARSEHDSEVKAMIEAWLRDLTVVDAITLLVEAAIPAAPVQDIRDACDGDYMQARGMMVEMDHPVAGRVRIPGNPLRFSTLDAQPTAASPLLGEHNDRVLRELLGYTEEEIDVLRRDNVL